MIDLNALPNKKPDEKTVFLLRRHWIVPAKLLSALGVMAALPVAGYIFAADEFPRLLTNPVLVPLMILAASFYYLAIWMFVFQEVVDYYLDTWIVTTERIINIEQYGLFRRVSAELHIGNIVDATSEVRGFLHTFLNYGDVLIQTAGERTRFHFKQVPRPEEVRQTVLKLVDEDKTKHGHEFATPLPSEPPPAANHTSSTPSAPEPPHR